MKDLIIPFKGLKDAVHLFESKLDKSFFDEFSPEDLDGGNVTVRINLDKKPHLMVFNIEIEGFVRVICDRCLEFYEQEVYFEGKFYVKFGEKNEEETEELIVLSREEYEVDLSKFVFDSIYLSLPIMRVHPDDENGDSTCDPDMLDKLSEHQTEINNIDPRWEALRNLKN